MEIRNSFIVSHQQSQVDKPQPPLGRGASETFLIILVCISVLTKLKIYKTAILPVILYECETWTLTLREEKRLQLVS